MHFEERIQQSWHWVMPISLFRHVQYAAIREQTPIQTIWTKLLICPSSGLENQQVIEYHSLQMRPMIKRKKQFTQAMFKKQQSYDSSLRCEVKRGKADASPACTSTQAILYTCLSGTRNPTRIKLQNLYLQTHHIEVVVAKAQRLPPSPQYHKQDF